MEKYSKWRDPSTGIQPFLPISAPSSSPFFKAVLFLPSVFHSLARAILLAADALLYLLLVEGVCLIFIPVPPLYRAVSSLFTALTCRLALLFMGYWWIETEVASPRRGAKAVAQITDMAPKRGDLIITNWTSYVDVLYLAFRHNPTFLLPVFAPLPPGPSSSSSSAGKTGRHTGTGSAAISLPTSTGPQPQLIAYQPISLPLLLARTGALPSTSPTAPAGSYKSLRDARRREHRPVCLLAEGTTGNGRAVLKIGEGVLADEEFSVAGKRDDEGRVWVKFIRHSAPKAFASSATCSLPRPMHHLLTQLLFTPTPLARRSLTVRTLHPSSSPSAPSFLPSEILASAPGGGLGEAGKSGKGAWKEAIGVVLAETGKVRRVAGMGWREKASFLEYWENTRKR